MTDPTKELLKHFTQRETTEQEGRSAAAVRARESADYQTRVADVLEEAIRPVMTDIRDFLLSRQLPAAVQFTRDLGSDTYGCAVSLHCSADPEDAHKSAPQLPFFAAYRLDRGKLVFRANKASGRILRPGESVEARCELADLTAEDANRRLIEFVKACFPI